MKAEDSCRGEAPLSALEQRYFVVIDIHCHILPAIDDGADDWEQTIKMARIAAEDGITGIVCTPHWSPSFPGNFRETILPLIDELRARLREENINVDVYPGCELVLSFGLPEMLGSGELLSINDGGTFALVETPYEIIPPNLDKLFWMIQIKGITPILAHPERNTRLQKDPMLLQKWVEAGALIQVTAGSIEGLFGNDARDFARELLRRRMVHFVGSDAHNSGRRSPALAEAREITASIIGQEEADRIFTHYPASIVRGELPEIEEPLPPDPRKPSLIERLFPFW